MDYLDRKWGIEMEWWKPDPLACLSRLQRKGFNQIGGNPGYSSSGHWGVQVKKREVAFTIKEDGSLPFGCEWVTPPLTWADKNQVPELIESAREIECKVGYNSGLHIHVGIDKPHNRSVDREMKLRTLILWEQILRPLRAKYPPRQSREEFCIMNLTQYQLENSRFNAVNLTRSHHNTVEYRFFNSTVRHKRILRFLEFSLAFTHLILSNNRLPTYRRGDPMDWVMKEADKI